MNKISIGFAVLCIAIFYVAWHLLYREEVTKINTVDNLAIENTKNEMKPSLWLRESYITKNGEEVLLEVKQECFSLYELRSLYSAQKDVGALQKFCESNVEDSANGYTITASCRNQSARFYVDVHWVSKHSKWYVWQQRIYDLNRTMIQQERITFQQQGTCDVAN